MEKRKRGENPPLSRSRDGNESPFFAVRRRKSYCGKPGKAGK